MSAPSNKNRVKNHHPKVISFRTTLDGLNIAAKQSILWPCHAFNISIPQKKKSSLNVFEETVLRITEIESGDTVKIAQLTCLEKELVRFIQNRLNQLNLLDNRYELSKEGENLLESWRSNNEKNIEYFAGMVFLDLLTGKLLPYIHIGNIKQEKIKSVEKQFVMLDFGSIGKSKSQKCRLISPTKNSYWKIVPDVNDIIRAIREYKKKYKRHALLNQGVDQCPPSVPMTEAISLHENPELVYLHCQAIIQVGNPNLLTTDGFGFGFSESFANYLINHAEEGKFKWVSSFKAKGVIKDLSSGNNVVGKTLNKSYKHAEISRRIRNSQNSLCKIKELRLDSSNYEREYKREIESGIKNIYASLEWAFRQVVVNNPAHEWEQIFNSQNYRDNEKLLYGFAKKIGFRVTEKNQSLLQVKRGAIKQIERGKVELQPLLAIAFAGANSHTNHPLHNLAKSHAVFLDHALRLKKYRDPIEHGSTNELDLDKKILEELIDTTVPIIISLVPGVRDDLETNVEFNAVGDINQERLKANIAIEKALGIAFIFDLSKDIKEQLIRAEIMLEKYSDDKVIEIIKCYASVMQHTLQSAIQDRKLDFNGDKMRDEAIEKIVQFGFYPTSGSIPKQISTVNTKRLYRAVQGSSTTLGAHLLAVFLLGSENELIQLGKLDPAFVDFIAILIRLRGHGNKHQSDFSRDDMESLKNKLFKAIKIITEVF